jgi:hypothetical protein
MQVAQQDIRQLTDVRSRKPAGAFGEINTNWLGVCAVSNLDETSASSRPGLMHCNQDQILNMGLKT